MLELLLGKLEAFEQAHADQSGDQNAFVSSSLRKAAEAAPEPEPAPRADETAAAGAAGTARQTRVDAMIAEDGVAGKCARARIQSYIRYLCNSHSCMPFLFFCQPRASTAVIHVVACMLHRCGEDGGGTPAL